MAPEYGATCGIFPVDAETLRYLRFTGRPDWQVKLVEAYCKEQGLFHTANTPEPTIQRHAGTRPGDRRAEPGRAGPAARSRPARRRRRVVRRRPAEPAGQGRPSRSRCLPSRPAHRPTEVSEAAGAAKDRRASDDRTAAPAVARPDGRRIRVRARRPQVAPRLGRHRGHHQLHEHVEPVGACWRPGLLAKKAVEQGPADASRGSRPAWRPARRSSPSTCKEAGLIEPLEKLGFNLVGYGCTTCIGNSGPLPELVSQADRRQPPGRRGGAERQPQFRGPRPCRGAGELSSRRRRWSSPTPWPAASTST